MKKILIIIIAFVAYLVIPRYSYASIIFQDNFNHDLNGSFPSKWTPLFLPGESLCNANWIVENGAVEMKIQNQNSCGRNIVPNLFEWSNPLSSYIYTVDAKFINGTDHNVGYRTNSNIGVFELHFQSPNDFGVSAPSPNIVQYNVPGNYINSNDHIYHIKTIINQGQLTIYIDGKKVREIFAPNLPAGTIALRASTGGDPNSETWFDNVIVRTIDEQNNLDVPLLYQTDPQWGNDIYANATTWATPSASMSSWGCAVTSAAMVFQYNGIRKMPDGSDLTPGTLNAWLKTQEDGYVRNGLVNWLALSRLSLLSKQINSLNFDALEYSRINHQSDASLSDSLGKNIPVILEEPGHFIVATGTDSAHSTFFMNDPYYQTKDSLNDGYNKQFLSMGMYTKSNTDLSYMMFVVDPNASITATDSQNNPVGGSYIQNPIVDPSSTSQSTTGAVRIFYFKNPSAGDYKLKVESASTNNLDGYLYDQSGNVKKVSFSERGNTYYTIHFDNSNVSNDTVVAKPIVTFDSLRQEINAYYHQKKIKEIRIYMSFIARLQIAKNARNKIIVKAVLNSMVQEINRNKKSIDSTTSEILISDIKTLISSL